MDVISFSEAATANDRIGKINANPDSNSGIVTQPMVIATGESVTIPSGRMAVLPNLQIDGELVVDGEVFVPSGATVGDLENQIATKAPLASPALTGTPTAPTATAGTNTTQIATTAFVQTVVGGTWIANDSRAKTALNASGTAPIYACRAWVNFNGTGTVAIRASGNVSSITDSGTGDYTANFTTTMPDSSYGRSVSAARTDGVIDPNFSAEPRNGGSLTTSIRVICGSPSDGALRDSSDVSIAIFR